MKNPIPPDIARHRTRGTEIKRVGSHFYIQRIKCVWDKAKKKRRKVIVEYIGAVTAEGIKPKQARKVPVHAAPHSVEFGATWAARQLSGDVKTTLEKHFGQDAAWIYATALLRCVHPGAMRYTGHHYETSWLREAMPGLDVSSETLSQNMRRLGQNRDAITAFMKEFVPGKDWYAILDGTVMTCNAKHIREAQPGYNPHGRHDPQIRIMYGLALKDDGLAPVFYKRYPGCIPDVSAFRNTANAMGLVSALILADKAFPTKHECRRLAAEGLQYIMPLRRNSAEYSRAALQQPGRTGFQGRFRYNGRMVWFHQEPHAADAEHTCILYLDEDLYNSETRSRVRGKLDGEKPAAVLASARKQLEFGTFALKTNLFAKTPEEIYRAYKKREEVEQLFDMYKSELQFATTGMHSAETQEACLFLNHLAVMMAYRFQDRLQRNGWLKQYAVQKTLEHLLKDIRATRFGSGAWQLEPVPKAARLALEAIGLTLPETPG